LSEAAFVPSAVLPSDGPAAGLRALKGPFDKVYELGE